MMKRYSRIFPPCLATNSPAAFADPPVQNLQSKFRAEAISGNLTGSNQVIYDNYILTGFDSVGLHFKRVLMKDVNERHTSRQNFQFTMPYSFS